MFLEAFDQNRVTQSDRVDDYVHQMRVRDLAHFEEIIRFQRFDPSVCLFLRVDHQRPLTGSGHDYRAIG